MLVFRLLCIFYDYKATETKVFLHVIDLEANYKCVLSHQTQKRWCDDGNERMIN